MSDGAIGNSYVAVAVQQIRMESPRVRKFVLACEDGWPLPPFTPGAHIDVLLPSGRLNQYSLCADPGERHSYTIAVLREEPGRGGSRELHAEIAPGQRLGISLPRNHFALAQGAARHLFIAGGIGITPFLSMIPALERDGQAYELHYCTRSREETAFLAFLESPQRTGAVRLYHDGTGQLDLAALLQTRREGEHAYCCGPQRMLDGFFDSCTHWPDEAVHHERFGATLPDATLVPYQVKLGKSGVVVDVAPGQTIAQALKQHGIALKTGCEAGICGVCKVGLLAGQPLHRDYVLSAEERKNFLMTCVSSGSAGDVELDL